MEKFVNENIHEFQRDGKSFMFFDISKVTNNEQMEAIAEEAKKRIVKYPLKSVYVITSNLNFFDTRTKEIGVEWIVFNKPYVIASALVDITAMTRLKAKTVYKKAEREEAKPFPTIEEAVNWLLTQDGLESEQA